MNRGASRRLGGGFANRIGKSDRVSGSVSF